MTKVFVSGSIHIKVLHSDVKDRIEKFVATNIDILIGDAPGVDTSVQEYMHHLGYRNITVYCIGGMPRNNVGQWPTMGVEPTGQPGSREFFTAKDKKMAADCDSGLLIWDGKSRGTKRNVVHRLFMTAARPSSMRRRMWRRPSRGSSSYPTCSGCARHSTARDARRRRRGYAPNWDWPADPTSRASWWPAMHLIDPSSIWRLRRLGRAPCAAWLQRAPSGRVHWLPWTGRKA